ncbi:MAG: hypothetical protein AABX59_01215, partial [Nanoarchaeota archaeon]
MERKHSILSILAISIILAVPLVSAQVFDQASEVLRQLAGSDYFLFITLFAAFLGLSFGSLSKIFERAPAILISLAISFLLAAAAVMTGTITLKTFAPWTPILLLILLLEIILLAFLKKEQTTSFAVASPIVVALAILVPGMLSDRVKAVWGPYLFYIVVFGVIFGFINLLYVLSLLTRSRAGTIGFPGGPGAPRGESGFRPALPHFLSPWAWSPRNWF